MDDEARKMILELVEAARKMRANAQAAQKQGKKEVHDYFMKKADHYIHQANCLKKVHAA